MSAAILVVYYSHSGNTRKIAGLIAEKTGGATGEIVPESPYPEEYNAVVEQAKKEIRAGFLPALKTKIDVASRDAVFVGTPNWWSTIAPPVAAFLAESDLAGKIVIPFCTHGGGGGGRIESDIAKLCPDSTVKPGLVVPGDGGTRASPRIAAWLGEIGIA